MEYCRVLPGLDAAEGFFDDRIATTLQVTIASVFKFGSPNSVFLRFKTSKKPTVVSLQRALQLQDEALERTLCMFWGSNFSLALLTRLVHTCTEISLLCRCLTSVTGMMVMTAWR